MVLTLLLLCQNYMPLCVRIGKLTRGASNARSGDGNACSSRSDSIVPSFGHSNLQSQRNAIYFLDLAAEQRIENPVLLSFDCGYPSSLWDGTARSCFPLELWLV